MLWFFALFGSLAAGAAMSSSSRGPQTAAPQNDTPPDVSDDTETGDEAGDDLHTGHDTPDPEPDDTPSGEGGEDTGAGDTPHMDHGDHEADGETDGGTHTGHGTAEVTPPPVGADQATIDAYIEAIRAQPETHMHADDSGKMTEHMAAMDLVPRDEATHIAISNGDWFDPDTWHTGEVPADDAKVLIPEGISVTYGSESDVSLFTVRVDGELDFDTDADSQMIFDTMIVSPTGCLVIGSVDDPVAADVSVKLVIADNGPINTDWDPTLLSRGIISHGDASIHGAEKDSHEKVTEDPMAGDTELTFEDLPLGWEVGDTIVVAGTRYDGHKWDNLLREVRLFESEDEIRVITGIEGNTVQFEQALEFDHDSPRGDLKTSVANYTRNVSVETENAEEVEISGRGHVMFMHSDDVDVRYAEFHELGRTDKSEPSQDISDFDPVESDSNVQGRYSLHLHRTGIDDPDDPSYLVGNAVWGSPGWGYVHHDSNAILENNASFDTFGAGYVAETGNETGAWVDNIAILAQGIDWNIPKNTTTIDEDTFDTARGGDGFWFQGRMVEASDNIAASVNTGFVYFHRDGDSRMIEFDASKFEYGDVFFGDDMVWPGLVPIREFSGNETFAAREGLHIVKANPNQGHDIWSELNGFTAWSVTSGAHLEYTSHYILNDFDLIGSDPEPGKHPEFGISFGNNTSDMVIADSHIEGFYTGIDLVKTFNGVAEPDDEHNYVVINAEFGNVETEIANYDPGLDQLFSDGELPGEQARLDLGDRLTFDGNPVSISGTKTDSIGETVFPGGTDSFDIQKPSVLNILEDDGYWTTSDGESYFNVDLYFTDRMTGEIYYETHPVFVDEDLAGFLSGPFGHYTEAVNNGEQDIVEINGQSFAGDQLLYTPIEAVPWNTTAMPDSTYFDVMEMPHAAVIDAGVPPDGQDILAALTHNQGTLDESLPLVPDSETEDIMLDDVA